MTPNQKATLEVMLNNFRLDKLEDKPRDEWEKGYNQGAITILETIIKHLEQKAN